MEPSSPKEELGQECFHRTLTLRHSCQDRLTAIDTPDRIQAELIGHKFDRPKYGDGPILELKAEWMKKISLKNLI